MRFGASKVCGNVGGSHKKSCLKIKEKMTSLGTIIYLNKILLLQGTIIYKSSAGSGKTYTLVTEYLKLVIPEPFLYRSILAITFTNKATDEMKSRIIQALARLSNLSQAEIEHDSQYQLLKTHLVSQAKGYLEVRKQAKSALTNILNDYGNFSVSTIESFMQRVIRAFTRELNIQLGYEIEMKQDVVLDSIVDAVFMEIGPGGKQSLTNLLQGFVDRKLEEEKSWHVEVDIKRLGRELFQEQFQELAVQIDKEQDNIEQSLSLDQQLWAIRKSFENSMKKIGQDAAALIQQFNLSVDDFSRKGTGPAGYLVRIGEQNIPDKYIPNSYAYTAYEDAEKWSTKTSKRKADILAIVANGLGDLLAEAIHQYESGWMAYQSAIQVLRTLHSFGLIYELEKQLKSYRRENNQLLISDTNFLLGHIIKGQDAPFIFEKVGTRYNYYLLDEFQDTSSMQWNNLYPLVIDALSQGKGALLVGDVKQSIYRWRNGNMRLLMGEVEAQLRPLGQDIQLKELKHNWRTAEKIVDFNNAFFQLGAALIGQHIEQRDAEELFESAYGSVKQIPQKTHIEGFVSVDYFPHRSFRDPPEVPAWEDLAERRCLEIIRNLMADGFLGAEIMLLVRRNREGIRLAEFLQANGIMVASAESLLIANHPQVLLLVSMLKHLKDETDSVTLASLRYYYARVIKGEGSSHQLFGGGGRKAITPDFDKLRPVLRKLAVYECIEQLLKLFPQLFEPNAYLQGFVDAVLSYTNTQDASISGFLNWWEGEKNKRAVAAISEPQAVQIMTIHKAKGLEFPVVIMPFAEWDMAPDFRDILWIKHPQKAPYNEFDFIPVHPSSKLKDTYFKEAYLEEELMSYLDNLNLLYVAFTRPKYRLYILSRLYQPKRAAANPLSQIYKLIQQIVQQMEVGGEMDEEQTHFELGNPISREEIRSLEKEPDAVTEEVLSLQANPASLANWNNSIRIRYSSNRFVKADILARTERISAGELLHEALAYIKTKEDIEAAVKKMFYKGYISAEQQPQLARQLHHIISNLNVLHWYTDNWDIRNEVEIISEEGGVLRPDRVMIQGDLAIVVDYKSGQENPRYHPQLRQYMKALSQMGYVSVKGYIYYLVLGKVDEVSVD